MMPDNTIFPKPFFCAENKRRKVRSVIRCSLLLFHFHWRSGRSINSRKFDQEETLQSRVGRRTSPSEVLAADLMSLWTEVLRL